MSSPVSMMTHFVVKGMANTKSRKVANHPLDKKIPKANLPHKTIENRHGMCIIGVSNVFVDVPPAIDRVIITLGKLWKANIDIF